MAESTARAFAGTWRDEASGEIRGYSFGGTICWFPRKPWALKISRDGFDHVIRCGECPGCLEFDRRRLADRLRHKYDPPGDRRQNRPTRRAMDPLAREKSDPQAVAKLSSAAASPRGQIAATEGREIWVVRIYAPLEQHARLSHSLHRRRGLELEPGYFRLGTTSFGLIARSRDRLTTILRQLGLEFRTEPVRLSRGRRAWRSLTAGILVARDAYGEQVKRWYARGLPPAARESWEVERRAMQKPWSRGTGARARTGAKLVLVPPEVWQVSRTLRRDFFRAYAKCDSPESSNALVAGLVAAFGQSARLSKPKPPAEGRLSPEQVQAGFREIARRMNARRSDQSDSRSSPPTSEVGGYGSSEHSGVAPPAEKGAWESYQEAKGRALERQRLKDQELFERFAKLGEKQRG